MNKKIIFSLLLWQWFVPLKSCDVCGCGIRDASFNMGFAQSIRSNILLLGMQHYQFQTRAMESPTYTVNDRVSRISIQYIHQWTPRWQATIQTEISHIERHNAYNEQGVWRSTNPGDLFLSAGYRAMDNRKNIFTKHHFLWLVGANAKLPTGYYQIRDDQKRLLPMQLQAGNGSYAAGIFSSVGYRYQDWGIQSQVQFLQQNTNEVGYQQGNQQQASLGVNYVIRGNSNHLVIPQIAYNYQTFGVDKLYKQAVPFSGGDFHSIQLQLEWLYKSFYTLCQIQIPTQTNTPIGAPEFQQSWQIRLGYILKETKKDMPNLPAK